MLRGILMALGILCLIGIVVVLVSGRGVTALPYLIAGAVVLGAGVAFERRRYKTIQSGPIEPWWQETGERFIDPETHMVTVVYYDPRTAERHYIAAHKR